MAVRQDIIAADKILVKKTINQLIQWIYEINFANAEVPVFELYESEDVNLTLAQRDKILSDTGVKFTNEYSLVFPSNLEDISLLCVELEHLLDKIILYIVNLC